MSAKATNSCKDKRFTGLKVGIYGVLHGVQALWSNILSTKNWGFLPVDAKNESNEINRIGMLWAVFHLCPFRACFFFNCYHHWSLLVLHNGNGTDIILHIREGMTQGGPLTMVVYGLRVLLIIKNLKIEHHDVMQPWYSDNLGSIGTFGSIEGCFNSLTQVFPYCGCYPKPTKSVLIVHPDNIEGWFFLARVTGLRSVRVSFIWVVLLVVIPPNQ